jgi:hypothetical protein
MLEEPRRPPTGETGGWRRLTAFAARQGRVTVITSAFEQAALEPIVAGWQVKLVVYSSILVYVCSHT